MPSAQRPTDPPGRPDGVLRVATFNLASGRLPDGRQGSPEQLAAAVRSLDADVLAVQEVDRNQPRSGGADQLSLVAEAAGAVAWRFVPTLHGRPGPAAGWTAAPQVDEGAVEHSTGGPSDDGTSYDGTTYDRPSYDGTSYDGPSYGVGLVSRLPVLSWRVQRYPASRGVLPFPLPGPGRVPRLLLVPDEPRVALAAVVAGPAGPVTVICAHLSFAPHASVLQLRRLTRWARALPGPRLLAGDLNLPGSIAARVSGWTALAQAATFPASGPRVQLDHLLLDRPPSGPVRSWTATVPVSDHRPLVVDLPAAVLTVARLSS